MLCEIQHHEWPENSERKLDQGNKINREVEKPLALLASPIRDHSRVESCHNCDVEMSPTHLCKDDQDLEEEEEEVKAMSTLEYQKKMVMLMSQIHKQCEAIS